MQASVERASKPAVDELAAMPPSFAVAPNSAEFASVYWVLRANPINCKTVSGFSDVLQRNFDFMNQSRQEALLLLGPTGSGKTPLGHLIAERGIHGRSTAHFDFGENLRAAATRSTADALFSLEDITFLRHVLDTGALLDDKDFPIAERILKWFIRCSASAPNTLIALNGLPRHTGQAKAIEPILDERTVVQLTCSPRTVFERIVANTGGDRTTRIDDELPAIERKLEIFADRTLPLVQHYEQTGARMVTIDVTIDMSPLAMWQLLEQRLQLQ